MKKRYNAIVLKKFSRFDCKESSSLVKMSNQAISVHGLFIIITKFRHILYRTSEHLSHTEEICMGRAECLRGQLTDILFTKDKVCFRTRKKYVWGGRSASAGSSRTYSLQKAKSAFSHGRNMYADGRMLSARLANDRLSVTACTLYEAVAVGTLGNGRVLLMSAYRDRAERAVILCHHVVLTL